MHLPNMHHTEPYPGRYLLLISYGWGITFHLVGFGGPEGKRHKLNERPSQFHLESIGPRHKISWRERALNLRSSFPLLIRLLLTLPISWRRGNTHSDDLRVFSRSRVEPGAMGYGLAIAPVRAWDGLGLVRENRPSLPFIPVDIW